ncbi:hypothetical protein [Chloroflexus sp.]|nr:hypothetical protein [Chloroflexus sp.]
MPERIAMAALRAGRATLCPYARLAMTRGERIGQRITPTGYRALTRT